MMDGLDLLGAEEVGVVRPVATKGQAIAAGKRAIAASNKLSRRFPRAAAKLMAVGKRAITKAGEVATAVKKAAVKPTVSPMALATKKPPARETMSHAAPVRETRQTPPASRAETIARARSRRGVLGTSGDIPGPSGDAPRPKPQVQEGGSSEGRVAMMAAAMGWAYATEAVAQAGEMLANVGPAVDTFKTSNPDLSTTAQTLAQQLNDVIASFDPDASSGEDGAGVPETVANLKPQVDAFLLKVSAASQTAPAPTGAPAPSGGGGSPASGGGGGGGGGADEGGDQGESQDGPPGGPGGEEGGEEGEDDGQADDQSALAALAARNAERQEADQDDESAEGSDDEDSASGDEGGDMADDSEVGSGFDLLGAEDWTGGGGHGGGGHGGGGHGGHRHGGHGHGGRGRGGWGWGGGGGPWYYDGAWYDDLDLLAENPTVDEIAEAVARKLKKTHVGYAAPETHWYTVATPGAMLDELDKVMREGDTLDRDFAAASVDSSTKAAWSSFLAGYKKFYADHEGWFSRLGSAVGDQIVAYGNQLNDWRAKLKSTGARVTEPSLTAIQVRTDPTKFNYMPLVIGALVILGLFGTGFAISKIALFRKKAA